MTKEHLLTDPFTILHRLQFQSTDRKKDLDKEGSLRQKRQETDRTNCYLYNHSTTLASRC